MKVLLLCSSFNGLSQRVSTELQESGHEVTVHAMSEHDDDGSGRDERVRRAVAATDPDIILCPFLKERVPDDVWTTRRTIIIHPGPKGDRGPSSLDWAITDGEPVWGVTALQAVAEMDAGPIWASRTFPMPAQPPRKSALYNGPVADAAVELVREVMVKATDPAFVPEPLDYDKPDVIGRLRPTMRQADRAFEWSDPTAEILRRVRAADGSPGVRTVLAGLPVSVFDAHPGVASPGEPGTIALRRHGAVLVRTGDGAVWIGHARHLDEERGPRIKLPATAVLAGRIADVPESLEPLSAETDPMGYREIGYRRLGRLGVLTFDFYNGAMSTAQCQRLAAALRYAASQDTRVLLIQCGEVFSNGIHLNVIEARPDPAMEAWRNINAINDVCREIITCTGQVVVVAMGGNAGAGGVILGLGGDTVLLRDGVVLNPHYRTMGLTGSEYWTYVLPRRVGTHEAMRLTEECRPVGAAEAARIGLVDKVLPGERAAFDAAVLEYARDLADSGRTERLIAAKREARAADEQRRPLETYRIRELAEMSRDIFDDRYGFAAARRAFVTKQPRPDRPGHASPAPLDTTAHRAG